MEIEIAQGDVAEGCFTIYAPEGKYTKGVISSTDPRMECLTTEFVGSEAEICFCFYGDQMEEGEVLRGEFNVISNRGEYYLPYVVTVAYSVPESSVGPVKNLFHFANLARSNWEEAVNLFYFSEYSNKPSAADDWMLHSFLYKVH